MTRLSWQDTEIFFLLIFLLSRTGYGKHDPFVVSGKIFLLLFILLLSQTGYRKNDLFVMSGKIFFCCFSFYARQDTGNITCLSWVGNLHWVRFSSMPNRIWETWPFVMSGKIFIVLDFSSMPDRISETWPVRHERENLYCVRFSF